MGGVKVATIVVASMLCSTMSAHGQTEGQAGAAPPVAASVEPDDPSKFFWFHKPDVTPDLARSDIETCFVQTAGIGGKIPPNPGVAFGLIGGLVGGLLTGVAQANNARRMRDATMRTCMALYGYARYQVPEVEWNAMMRAPDAMDRLTAFASGTKPPTERIDA